MVRLELEKRGFEMGSWEGMKFAEATSIASLTTKIFLPTIRDAPMSKVLDNPRHNIVSRRNKKTLTQRCSFLTILSHSSRTALEETIKSGIPDKLDHETKRNLSGYVIFPCYRSWRNDRYGDVVLVKDACVSCSILTSENSVNLEKQSLKPEASLESKFVKQLRSECKDLAAITRKISSYTREMLSGIAKKTRKKNSLRPEINGSHGVAMQPVALQYYDKFGKPCLKLRLRESSGSIFERYSSSIDMIQSGLLINSARNTAPQMRRVFPDRFSSSIDENSPICSSTSAYHRLVDRGGVISSEAKKRCES